jgi:xylobiose transport system permease protein
MNSRARLSGIVAGSAAAALPLVPPLSCCIVRNRSGAAPGFLFPLVFTQSDSTKAVTLGLYNSQPPFGIDVPRLLAAVVMSMMPVLLVCLFARRALVQGLMGVDGK